MTRCIIPPDSIDAPDEQTRTLYLEVPGSKVVLLQAYFELYEGVGVVRTLNIRSSLVCVLTTESLLHDCLDVLDAIQKETQWRFTPRPPQAEREKYLGYFSK